MYNSALLKRVRHVALTIILGILVIVAPRSVNAASVTLAWDNSTNSAVTGYNLYYGTSSRTYSQIVSVGNSTNATVSGLVVGTTYYFAATAYNASGAESDFSNEATYTPAAGSNAPPTINPISNVTVNEDIGAQSITLTGITSGSTNEIQTLSVTASSSNPSLTSTLSVNYTSPNSTGTLLFTPAPNAFGNATITVTVNDGQSTTSTSFVLTVNPVNDPPTLTQIANITVNQNSGPQNVALSGITSGAPNENDTLSISATSSNPGLIPNPSITYTSPNTTGTLTFTPVANASGTATITVTVNDNQPANNTVSRSFTVTVAPVNQPPTLNPLNNLTINEDSGTVNVPLTGITSGSTNENQTLSVTATTSNPNLTPSLSIVYTSPSTSGALVFAPAPGLNGTAVITVTVNDGGAQNNTISRSFTLTVAPVNDPPTLNPISDVTVNANSGAHNVALTGITSGAPNENDTLSVSAVSSNPGLIPNPTIAYTSPNTNGVLTFNAPASTGFATISVTVNDGQATSNTVTRSFNVTVAAATNTPPTISTIADEIMYQNTNSGPIAFTVSDNETPASSLVVSAGSSNPTLLPVANITFGGSGNNRTVTLTPVVGQVGSAAVTVTVSDGSATASTTFQLTVLVSKPIDTPPVISPIGNQITSFNTPTPAIPFSIGDTETPASSLTLSATSSDQSVVPNANIVFGGSASNRTVTVTPAANMTGTVAIAVSVSDGTMAASNVFQVTVLPTIQVNVTKVGNGSVAPDLTGETLVPGQTYTMTAVPASGQQFTGWSGSFISTSAKLTFVPTSNVNLTANFAPVVNFAAQNGIFSGLFYEATEVNQGSSGSFSVTTTTRGSYSGRVQVGVNRFSISGTLSSLGQATNIISRHNKSPLTLHLNLGSGAQADQISGDLTDGNWLAVLSGDRATWNATTNPAPVAGTYTVVIPGQTSDPTLPTGDGSGSVKVTAGGIASFSGTLGDGTKVSQSAYISKQNMWPFYAYLYSGNGSMLSWIAIHQPAQNNLNINGQVSWIKLAIPGALDFPGGFTNECQIIGSTYVPPVVTTGDHILNLDSAGVVFDASALRPSFTNMVALGRSSRVTNLSSNQLSLTFSLTTGTFRGSVTDPKLHKPITFVGAVLQGLNAGYGTLLGHGQSAKVSFLMREDDGNIVFPPGD
jgi:hypothetical protein